MNEIRRQRLQNQIFRHVALYYQKMSRGQDAQGLILDTPAKSGAEPMSIKAQSRGQESQKNTTPSEKPAASPSPLSPFAGESPFSTGENPHDFTQLMSDYCTFTRCELSSDGSFAKIYVSIWGDAREQERIMKDIQRHVRGMRSSIAKHVRMRVVPQLAFVQDKSFEKGAQIEKMLQ